MLALLLINFTSSAFVRCREEIADCVNSNTTRSLNFFFTVIKDMLLQYHTPPLHQSTSNCGRALSIALRMCCWPALPCCITCGGTVSDMFEVSISHCNLSTAGNLNPDTSLAQLSVHHAVIIMSTCIVLHFAIALFVENPPNSAHLMLGQITVARE